MKTPINKPPRSKIVQVIKEDKDKRFLVKESLKGKWKYFAVEFKKDEFSKQANRINTIAERIALRNSLIDSTSIDNYMLSNTGISTSACNGRLARANCHQTKQSRHKRLESK